MVTKTSPSTTTRSRPIGIWLSLAANGIAVCAGAVFLISDPGSRFRGMEPEAQLFIVLISMATALGLFIALPMSIADLFRRHWLWGSVGSMCALSPYLLANVVADLVGQLLNIHFD